MAAYVLVRPLADQGVADAQYGLGQCAIDGQGVARDYAAASEWYRKAAEQGLARAENDLGSMYANGEGGRRDFAEAAKWYAKAAEQGIAVSQYGLGLMFASGQGVSRLHRSSEVARKAADQNHAEAQAYLGTMSFSRPRGSERLCCSRAVVSEGRRQWCCQCSVKPRDRVSQGSGRATRLL